VHLVLTVEADADSVDARLRSGGVACPDCSESLSPWGFARPRVLRSVEGDRLRVRPRRGSCAGCGRTHVLLPLVGLSRRADSAAVIGAGLQARARGLGQRRIAALLGRAPSTVRGWLRRFAGRAEAVRQLFTALLCALDGDPPRLEPAGSVFADAVAAVTAAAGAVGRRWVGLVLAVSVWEVAAAVTDGRLLSPVWPTELTNTSRPWERSH
jgi:Homeodomain-like domain-containing protein